MDVESKIILVLDSIRPYLQEDGGDVEFVSYDPETQVVQVRLQGHCDGCPFAQMTVKNTIEAVMQEIIPEIAEVVAVQE